MLPLDPSTVIYVNFSIPYGRPVGAATRNESPVLYILPYDCLHDVLSCIHVHAICNLLAIIMNTGLKVVYYRWL